MARWNPASFGGTVLLLLFGPVSPLEAQSGLKGGINLNQFFGSTVDETDTQTGLNLGASLGLVSLGPLQLVGEVYYRQKGGKGNIDYFQDPSTTTGPVEVGIDYVEVPILARINLGSVGGKLFPYLEGGPAFGWQIDCGVEAGAQGNGEVACDDLLENAEETLKDYELGAVLGGGVDFVLGPGMGINLDVRYTAGLSDLTPDAEIKNRSFTVMLGYAFNLPGGGMGGGMGPMGGMTGNRIP